MCDLSGHTTEYYNGTWSRSELYAGGTRLATYIGGETAFVYSDWVGNHRTYADQKGAAFEPCTNLPFGDGQSCTGTPWGWDFFTDDIHDSESNTEHTDFRQLSGTQGRWLSPDPYNGSMDISNPQSLNRYAYVGNDPINALDPNGLDCVYFNNQGNQAEFIDANSTAGFCGEDGGTWVNGTADSISYNAGTDTFTINSSDTNYSYSTQTSAPGMNMDGYFCPGNCASGYSQAPINLADLAWNANVALQLSLRPVNGEIHGDAGIAALTNAFAAFPNVCSLGINGSVGGNRASVGLDANTATGVHPFGQVSTPVAPFTSIRYNIGTNGETPRLSVRIGPPTGPAGTMGFTPDGLITSVGANAQITAPGIGKAGVTAYARIGSLNQCK